MMCSVDVFGKQACQMKLHVDTTCMGCFPGSSGKCVGGNVGADLSLSGIFDIFHQVPSFSLRNFGRYTPEIWHRYQTSPYLKGNTCSDPWFWGPPAVSCRGCNLEIQKVSEALGSMIHLQWPICHVFYSFEPQKCPQKIHHEGDPVGLTCWKSASVRCPLPFCKDILDHNLGNPKKCHCWKNFAEH